MIQDQAGAKPQDFDYVEYATDRRAYFLTVVRELQQLAAEPQPRLTSEDLHFLKQAGENLACKADELVDLVDKLFAPEDQGDVWDAVAVLSEAAHEIGRRGNASQNALADAKRQRQSELGKKRSADLRDRATLWHEFVETYTDGGTKYTDKPASFVARNAVKNMPFYDNFKPASDTVARFVTKLREQAAIEDRGSDSAGLIP